MLRFQKNCYLTFNTCCVIVAITESEGKEMKIKGQIRDLMEQAVRLEDNQILQLQVPSLSQAKNLMRQLKAARKILEDEGILDVPLEIRQEELNGRWLIQIYKERPITVELVEIDEAGDAIIKDSYNLGER